MAVEWSEDVADRICKRIAEGESLRNICLDDSLPHISQVYRHLPKDEKFREQYARAREAQTEKFLEDIIEIADNCTDDVELIKDYKGDDKEVIKHSAIQRARLQIDARKWAMSKLAPKRYGDKIQNEHSGQVAMVNIIDDIPEA